ncbi:hypothetical protein [Prosthecobacter sp.]|jgi:hypothetical protein|uniref:hypothetical protein n=1 Tax=Prosthecobacter sp. TaxID=1965333 RepID=UPI0037C80C8C
MFEKPKSLIELSEHEFENLASYMNGAWDGSGPDPGYCWNEFFSDADLGKVPEWFDEWLAVFELEELVFLEREDNDAWAALFLLKDTKSNQFVVYKSMRDDPPVRAGELCYSIDSMNPEILRAFVDDFLGPEGIKQIGVRLNQELVPLF